MEKLAHKKLGSTGLDVSPLGLGTVKIGRNVGVKNACGDGFSLPSSSEIEALLEAAISCGVNVLDTAPAYGFSEEKLGEVLKKYRSHFHVFSKTGEEFENGVSAFDFSAAHTRMSVERSLRRLKTDVLEGVMVHSNGDDMDIIQNTAVLETLSRLKEKGDIRSFGFSGKTVEGGKKAVELCDTVMVSANPSYNAEDEVIAYAQKLAKGVFIKKGLMQGHVANVSVQDCLAHSLQSLQANCLIFGTLNSKHVLDNARMAAAL